MNGSTNFFKEEMFNPIFGPNTDKSYSLSFVLTKTVEIRGLAHNVLYNNKILRFKQHDTKQDWRKFLLNHVSQFFILKELEYLQPYQFVGTLGDCAEYVVNILSCLIHVRVDSKLRFIVFHFSDDPTTYKLSSLESLDPDTKFLVLPKNTLEIDEVIFQTLNLQVKLPVLREVFSNTGTLALDLMTMDRIYKGFGAKINSAVSSMQYLFKTDWVNDIREISPLTIDVMDKDNNKFAVYLMCDLIRTKNILADYILSMIALNPKEITEYIEMYLNQYNGYITLDTSDKLKLIE